MKDYLALWAGLGVFALTACSPIIADQGDDAKFSDRSELKNCKTVIFAFHGFEDQLVELRLQETLQFSEKLHTPDWSNEVSKITEICVKPSDKIRITIDRVSIYDHHLENSRVRTIYVTPRDDFVTQTDHPFPLLD